MFSQASVHPHLWGVTPSQVQMRGHPILGQDGEGNPIPLMGVPISGLDGGGTLSCWLGGYPIKDQDGGYGVPPCQQDGVPPVKDWMGYTHLPSLIRRQITIASTCYTAGGVPLAFTQEDFLVLFGFFQKETMLRFFFNCKGKNVTSNVNHLLVCLCSNIPVIQ